jgi:hypothetical protein
MLCEASMSKKVKSFLPSYMIDSSTRLPPPSLGKSMKCGGTHLYYIGFVALGHNHCCDSHKSHL